MGVSSESTDRARPEFALAHADIADSYLMLSTTVGPAHELMPQVRAHAQKALDLDSSLPEAQELSRFHSIRRKRHRGFCR
jgi:hypothetical protein